MNILLVSQYYWPENFRFTNIAETLQIKGNKTTVITGLPNYPDGKIFKDYTYGKNRNQMHNDVYVIRAKLFGRKHNILSRFLNYYSFPFFANKLVNKIYDDFDVVLINELSPIMGARPGIKYAKMHNKKAIIYEMDLWPESLLAGGIKKNGLIYNHYKKVSAKIYSQCDKILVSTKEHIDYIKALPGCNKLDIEYLPQYAESIFEETDCNTSNDGVIDLMFAGNIGKAQQIETIIKAAEILKHNNKLKFHIVGSGSEHNHAVEMVKELKLDNVIFYGQLPVEDMPNLYRKADVMLVTLEDKPYANMTIPGKVQSYMAAGKPVIGAINGATANFIVNNEIGYVVNSGDYKALGDLILKLDMNELQKIGKHAREVYMAKYSKERFIKRLTEVLEEFSSK